MRKEEENLGVVENAFASPLDWFENFAWITDKGNLERPLSSVNPNLPHIPPGPNILQIQLFRIFEYCFKKRIPCRIIGLKPRKTGLSTACQALAYWCHRTGTLADSAIPVSVNSCTIGDEYETSNTIRNIFNTFVKHDICPWPGGSPTKIDRSWNFVQGGKNAIETAKDESAGRGSTPVFLHASEFAHWGNKDGKVFAGISQSIALVPGTVIILESTPEGATNKFAQLYNGDSTNEDKNLQRGAVSFEDFKAGKRGNGWIKLFQPWFNFKEYHIPKDQLSQEAIDELTSTLTAEEERLIDKNGLAMEQLMWRREKIASLGDTDQFIQEYTEDEHRCFLTSGNPRFNPKIVDRIELKSRVTPDFVSLHRQTTGTVGLEYRGMKDCDFYLWEKPRRGCKYLFVADTMTGADSVADSGKSDTHSGWILRAAYIDDNGVVHKPATVARTPHWCRWETTVAVNNCISLIRYFGDPIAVIESNNSGLTWIKLMAEEGVNLYRRESYDTTSRKPKKIFGWNTTKTTKPIAIDDLEKKMLEEEIEILDTEAIRQIRTFMRTEKGTMEASPGGFDDDVMALAIGFCLIENATEYRGQRAR